MSRTEGWDLVPLLEREEVRSRVEMVARQRALYDRGWGHENGDRREAVFELGWQGVRENKGRWSKGLVSPEYVDTTVGKPGRGKAKRKDQDDGSESEGEVGQGKGKGEDDDRSQKGKDGGSKVEQSETGSEASQPRLGVGGLTRGARETEKGGRRLRKRSEKAKGKGGGESRWEGGKEGGKGKGGERKRSKKKGGGG